MVFGLYQRHPKNLDMTYVHNLEGSFTIRPKTLHLNIYIYGSKTLCYLDVF
jgi:hypothetical protein